MYTFESRVRYSETDENGLLSIAGIVDYFQDVSTFQSEDLGIGVEDPAMQPKYAVGDECVADRDPQIPVSGPVVSWLKQAEALREMLVLKVQENLNIAGARGYEEFEEQPERLMNELNEAAPKVIFSRMTFPTDLALMHAGRKFLNAELWVALPDTKLKERQKPTFWGNIGKNSSRKR